MATLAFFYRAREVCLEKLELDETPSTYDLCVTHADRMRPPYGWVLTDRRAVPGPTGTDPDSTEGADHSRSSLLTSADAGRPFRWLGVAVETTVAFYPPESEAFEDLATIGSTEEARLVVPVRMEEQTVGPALDDDRPADPALDEDRLVGPALDEDRLVGPALDEDWLVGPALDEDRPDEDFVVPVRARTW